MATQTRGDAPETGLGAKHTQQQLRVQLPPVQAAGAATTGGEAIERQVVSQRIVRIARADPDTEARLSWGHADDDLMRSPRLSMQGRGASGTVWRMCARYLTPEQAAAERYWRTISPLWHFQASWRVLPTQRVPVVLAIDGAVTGRMMRWGLIPQRGEIRYPLINATVEKLESWYGWRHPWEQGQRCLLVMAGFYEPHVFPGGRKEPFVVRLTDRPIFGVAGIWERRRAEDGAEVLSCALITTPPNRLLAEVHNEKPRMPAVLREEDHSAWLTGQPAEALAALRPYEAEGMRAWQVGRGLYARSTSDDARLIEPVSP